MGGHAGPSRGEDRAREVSARLARWVGLPAGLLYPSSLHAWFDLLAALATEPISVYRDPRAYPVLSWAVDCFLPRSTPRRLLPHLSGAGIGEQLAADRAAGRRPVIVTEGLCGGCGSTAPLGELLRLLEPFHGLLIVDDTQSLGVLGRSGAGLASLVQPAGDRLVVLSSLAKGLGVPVAFLGAPGTLVARLARGGLTRVHCSGTSAADLSAVEAALASSERHGRGLRGRLAHLIFRLRRGLRRLGLRPQMAPTPVQIVGRAARRLAFALDARLRRVGIRALLLRARCRAGVTVAVSLTATHCTADVDRLLQALRSVLDRDRHLLVPCSQPERPR
jgi:8-amino-7-oxononanoate synthase